METTLAELRDFDGSVNMTDVMALDRRLLDLNATVAALSLAANQSLAQLLADQDRIYAAWEELQMLDSEVEGIEGNFTEGEATVEPILVLIDSANETYMIFRQNLTELDMQADRLARELDSLTTRADNVSMDALSLNESFAVYLAEVERRRVEITELMALVRVLNDSVLSVERAAEEAERTAKYLMVRM